MQMMWRIQERLVVPMKLFNKSPKSTFQLGKWIMAMALCVIHEIQAVGGAEAYLKIIPLYIILEDHSDTDTGMSVDFLLC